MTLATTEMASAKAAAHVSAAKAAAHVTATAAAVSTAASAASAAARKRVSAQSPGESGSRSQNDHRLT
jgi:hypothetical protein